MGFYLKDGTYIDDPSLTQAQADTLYTANQARNAQHTMPNLPPSDLATMVDWSIPARKDSQGRTYQTTYTGQPFYVNDGSVSMPSNTFMHQYAWDPTTGTYKQSLNQSGILGAIEGGTALAGPAIIGPLLTGSPTIFAATPAAAAAGGNGSFAGVLPSQSLAGIPGMTAAAPSVAGAAQTAADLLPSAGLAGIPGMTGTAPAVAGAGSAGSSLLKNILSNGSLLKGLAAAGLGGLSAINSFKTPSAEGDLSNAVNAAMARSQATEPLFEALTRMAGANLPTYAKSGGA